MLLGEAKSRGTKLSLFSPSSSLLFGDNEEEDGLSSDPSWVVARQHDPLRNLVDKQRRQDMNNHYPDTVKNAIEKLEEALHDLRIVQQNLDELHRK